MYSIRPTQISVTVGVKCRIENSTDDTQFGHQTPSGFSSASIMATANPSTDMSMDVDQDALVTESVRPSTYPQDIRASSLPLRLSPEKRTVGYVFSAEMMLHFSTHGHPEQPERITYIHKALDVEGCISQMKHLHIRPVRKEESLLVHSEDHWDKVRDIQSELA